MKTSSKIKNVTELCAMRDSLYAEDKKVIFTNGCFDIIHRGHAEYLERASELGDILVVGLNSDNSVRRLKGEGRPLMSEGDRAFIVGSFGYVSYVCIFNEDTPLELITELKPDVLVKGEDYQINQIVGREVVEENGGKVITIPLVPGRSTTEIIQKIKQLDNGNSQEMLD